MLFFKGFINNYDDFKAIFYDDEGKKDALKTSFVTFKMIKSLNGEMGCLDNPIKATRFANWIASRMDSLMSYSKDMIYQEMLDFLGSTYLNNTCSLMMKKGEYVNMPSDIYHTDEKNGMCDDGDGRSIRYIKNDCGRAFKMKSGKFIRKSIEYYNSKSRLKIPEKLAIYMGERFAVEWRSAHDFMGQKVELVIDDDFESIYNQDNCDGDFGSCMTDNRQYSFYNNAINASAASIRSKETGLILARCILYNEVFDDKSGKAFRLAERQYAKNGDLYLKQLLIDKLIEAEAIDGYKQVGASYEDAMKYVDVEGNSLEDHRLYINITIQYGDTLSYQDSFKYYNDEDRVAYNDDTVSYNYDMATCSNEFEFEREEEYLYWSSDYGEYRSGSASMSWINENCSWCDEEDAYLEDYILYDGNIYSYTSRHVEYCEDDGNRHHIDELMRCDNDDQYHLEENVVSIGNCPYYKYSPDIVCTINGTYVLEEDSFETEGGYIVDGNDESQYIEFDELYYAIEKKTGRILCDEEVANAHSDTIFYCEGYCYFDSKMIQIGKKKFPKCDLLRVREQYLKAISDEVNKQLETETINKKQEETA